MSRVVVVGLYVATQYSVVPVPKAGLCRRRKYLLGTDNEQRSNSCGLSKVSFPRILNNGVKLYTLGTYLHKVLSNFMQKFRRNYVNFT